MEAKTGLTYFNFTRKEGSFVLKNSNIYYSACTLCLFSSKEDKIVFPKCTTFFMHSLTVSLLQFSPYFLFVPSLVPGLADNRQTTNQCMGTYGGVQKPLTSVVGVVWCRSD